MRKTMLIATLGLCALAACSDDDSTGPVNRGSVRVVNAVSNVATADVLFGADVKKAGLLYKGSYENGSVAAGDLTIKLRKGGAAADLVSVNQNVAASKAYTVIAFGSEAAPQSLVLTDDRSAPANGKAKVRVAHAAAGQGAVDVYVVKAAGDLATATAKKTALAVKSASDYVELPGDTYLVVLTATGTKTPLLTVQGVALTAGKVLTVAAVEKAGGGAPIEGVVLADR